MPPSSTGGKPCPKCGGETRTDRYRLDGCLDEKCRHASWVDAVANSPFSRGTVPKRYMKARTRDFKTVPEPNEDGLYLSGGAGRGKTHMATAILGAEIVKRLAALPVDSFETHDYYRGHTDMVARWISVPELMLELRATMDKGGETEAEVLKRYTRPELLVLDDLYAEKVTEWTSQGVYTLISRRLNNLKPTIVTSNKTLTEIHATDPRLASRLGGMTYYDVKGEDRRVSK